MMSSGITYIKDRVLEYLRDQEVGILLFGPRSRKNRHRGSDIDIGIIPKGRFDPQRLVLLRNFLENLNTPYKVDLVDFSKVSEVFKKEALKEAEWWRD